MKGQVSVEMLVLLAVVIGVVAIAASYLLEVGEKASETVRMQSNSTLDGIKTHSKGDPGDPCLVGEDCKSGSCSDNRCS